jgi:hypothetical protein
MSNDDGFGMKQSLMGSEGMRDRTELWGEGHPGDGAIAEHGERRITT